MMGYKHKLVVCKKKNPLFDIQNKPWQLLELPAQNIYTFIGIFRFPVTKKEKFSLISQGSPVTKIAIRCGFCKEDYGSRLRT